jgi:hypothetical protein
MRTSTHWKSNGSTNFLATFRTLVRDSKGLKDRVFFDNSGEGRTGSFASVLSVMLQSMVVCLQSIFCRVQAAEGDFRFSVRPKSFGAKRSQARRSKEAKFGARNEAKLVRNEAKFGAPTKPNSARNEAKLGAKRSQDRAPNKAKLGEK